MDPSPYKKWVKQRQVDTTLRRGTLGTALRRYQAGFNIAIAEMPTINLQAR